MGSEGVAGLSCWCGPVPAGVWPAPRTWWEHAPQDLVVISYTVNCDDLRSAGGLDPLQPRLGPSELCKQEIWEVLVVAGTDNLSLVGDDSCVVWYVTPPAPSLRSRL